MTEYRAEFDAVVTFGNGGSLRTEGFRIDLPAPDPTEAEIAELFVASLGLLLTERVELTNVRILTEAHKGTRGGPADAPASAATDGRLVELSHPITEGMTTYPGLPGPRITPHLTRAASRARYAPGTEFAIDIVTICTNTGTYLDSPFHRYADGTDLADLPLTSFAHRPAVVLRTAGSGVRAVDRPLLAALPDVAGCAVLLHTGGDVHFGTPAYAENAPFLTEAGARYLVERGVALVGIDAVNIDELSPTGERPAHTLLLAAGIPIVEHLTGLDQLPPTGARFTAAPARLRGAGTFTVRAFAVLPE